MCFKKLWIATSAVLLAAWVPAPPVQAQPQFIASWGGLGSGPGQFNTPFDVALGPNGEVFVADLGNVRVQKFDSMGNYLLEWGTFPEPFGITVSPSGFVYLTRPAGQIHKVWKLDLDGNFILGWGSDGTGDGQFVQAWGLATDAQGCVYVTSATDGRIEKFDDQGNFILSWFVELPIDVEVDADGNVFTAGAFPPFVRKFDSQGNLLASWGTTGSGPGQFATSAGGIAIDSDGSVYVSDVSNHRVQQFSPSGTFVSEWGHLGTAEGEFLFPEGVEARDGIIYVADADNNRIQLFGTSVAVEQRTWSAVKRLYSAR